MPNHVTNRIIIVGTQEDIEFVQQHMKSHDRLFDFNRLIPMPESLAITSGSAVSNGVAVLLSRQGDHSKLDAIRNYKWKGTEDMNREEFIDYLIKDCATDLDEAQSAIDNLFKYGHQDWYTWSIENWGTKWNAYSHKELEDGFQFDTAWSHPQPIIEKLCDFFPNITFNVSWADEDMGYNVGTYTVKGDEVISQNIPEDGSKEAYKLAFELKGEDVDNLYDMVLEYPEDVDEGLEDESTYYTNVMEILVDTERVDKEFTEAQINWAINYATEQEMFEYAEKLQALLSEEIN